MKRVTVHDAKLHLSQLLKAVSLGEEVVISRAGRGIARLVPMGPTARLRDYDDLIDLADDFEAMASTGGIARSKR
jgi:prevent-host-death family protein